MNLAMAIDSADSDSKTPETPPNTWKQVLEENGSRFQLYARQQVRNDADAQDILQEALVKAWRASGGEERLEVGFVYTYIRRTAIDWGRSHERRQKREQKSLRDSIWAQPTPTVWFERTLETDERHREIEAAIQQLPEEQQEVLVLKIWADLTFDTIARTLEASPNTVASRYRYGLQNLKRILSPQQES
ncbi:MAG: sigma-70 family RNA polymerase sigma factor [Verrucomicrobiota bacterium]